MNRVLLCLVGALLGGGPVMAADVAVDPLPYKAPPLPRPPSWSGPFAGLAIGYQFGSLSNSVSGKNLYCGVIPAFCPTASQLFVPSGDDDGGSIGGGIQAGYNVQGSWGWVWGGVADIGYFRRHIGTSYTTPTYDVSPIAAPGSQSEIRTYTDSFDHQWLATARLRLGPTWNGLWLYGTGGLALADLRSNSSTRTLLTQVGNPLSPQPAVSGSAASSNVGVGFTLGGGLELRFDPHWTVFAEYLYYNVGAEAYTVVVQPAAFTGVVGTSSYEVKPKLEGNIVRIGINYLFWEY